MTQVDRRTYNALYGPTTGDRIRLGDTCLWVEVEQDDGTPGDELLGGCGKTVRDGLLASPRSERDSALDMVVAGVVLMDPVLGVRKTDIGIKDGRIVAVGGVGNPDVMDVDFAIDSHTSVIPGEGLIATPGIVDSHVHLSSPEVAPAALSAGVTTLVGMGLGGVWEIGCNPAHNLHTLMASWRGTPLNIAFLARGSSTSRALLDESVLAGAAWLQDPRGLRGHPAHHRDVSGHRGTGGPARRHAHRLHERVRLSARHHRCHPWPHGARIPRGGRRRSPRPPGDPLRAQRASLVDHPDGSVHRQHRRRAVPDDDDGPPAEPPLAQRHRDLQGPHPRPRHRRRERPARPGRDQHRQLRLHGHGADGRDGAQDLAARPCAGPRERRRGSGTLRQRTSVALPGEDHPEPGDRARPGPRGGIPPAGPHGRPRAVAPRVVRHQARTRRQGRLRGLGQHRLRLRLHPTDPAPHLPPLLRRARRRPRTPLADLRRAGRPGGPGRPRRTPARPAVRADQPAHAA